MLARPLGEIGVAQSAQPEGRRGGHALSLHSLILQVEGVARDQQTLDATMTTKTAVHGLLPEGRRFGPRRRLRIARINAWTP